MFPPILGAVAYVMFESGAAIAASEPVTTPADIAISLFPRAGVSHSGVAHAHGRAHHLEHTDTTHRTSFVDGTCEGADGTLYEQRTPPEQYAPAEWVIWPVAPDQQSKVFGDHGGTHNTGRVRRD